MVICMLTAIRLLLTFFFFSSRIRHTRWTGDWSSDVCSSDLGVTFPVPTVGFRSLVPVLVPRRLWDQANAADSITFDAAFVAGPALAGVAVTLVGATFAIALQADRKSVV